MTSLSTLLTRLVWFSLLPLVLFASGLAAYHVHSEQLATREGAVRRLGNFVAQIDSFLGARIQALSMLADSPLADDPKRWPELYAEAQSFRASFGSHVIFANAERQMLFNTRVPFGTALPPLPDARKGRSAAPVALETGKAAIGDIVQGPVIDEPLVAIVVPGLRSGRVRHLMLVTTTTRELQQLVDTIPMPPGWAFSVRDSAGELIARHAPAGFDQARDVDADWRFTAKSQLAPWMITVEVPHKVAHQPLINSLALLVLSIIITTLAGRILGRRIGKRIERQITALSHVDYNASLVVDITEIAAVRERLDASLIALRERDRRFSAIIEHSPSALSLKTPDGKYVLANPNLQCILHLSEAEIVGKTDFDLYPEATAHAFQENEQLALGASELNAIEEVIPVDGKPRRFLSNIFPVRNGQEEVEFICRISLDITSSNAAEQALAESEALRKTEIAAALETQRRGRLAALNLMDDAITARYRAEAMTEAQTTQLEELRRWQQVTLGREGRVLELKNEVNDLLAQHGEPPRYASAEAGRGGK